MADEAKEMEEEKPAPKKKAPAKKKAAPKKKAPAKKKAAPKKMMCPEGCDGSCEDCDRDGCDCKKESVEMVEVKTDEMPMVENPPRNIYRETIPTTARKLSAIRKEKGRLAQKYIGKARRL